MKDIKCLLAFTLSLQHDPVHVQMFHFVLWSPLLVKVKIRLLSHSHRLLDILDLI